MKNIEINNPCSENWNEMSKNDKGAFCQKCASQVHDFTKKSSLEIKQTLLSLIGQSVCGRITSSQEMELNEDFNRWMNRQNKDSFQSQLLFALLLVFGLGLFSCETKQDEKNLKEIQTSVARIIDEQQDTLELINPAPKMGKLKPQAPMIVGEIQLDNPITSKHYLEEKKCDKTKETEDIMLTREILNYGYAGGISYSKEYENYLIDEVNLAEFVELDENRTRSPKSVDTKVYPNPATEETTFELHIPTKEIFEINLFDMNGKMLKKIHSGELDKGLFRQKIPILNFTPGTYLIVIESNTIKESVKFVKN